ncbi:MAG: lipoate--protein ligase family protein [Pirellulales bacterium]
MTATHAASPIWLDTELDTVEENLALDEALLEAAHEGRLATAVVRTWMATTPTVVLGSSSRIAAEVDPDACAAADVRLIRRPSGGLTVVLGPGCLMWSVIVPHPQGSPGLEAIHAAMLEPLARALCSAGRDVRRRGTSDLAVLDGSIERKVSGNALRVKRHGVLYHGTLLDSFDLDLISRVLRHPPQEPAYRAGRSHAGFVANLGLGRPRLKAAVREAFQATGSAEALGDWPPDRVRQLVAERYASSAWTQRL